MSSARTQQPPEEGRSRSYSSVGIIVPVFNEAEILELFHRRLSKALHSVTADVNIWYVDDGSSDGTDRVIGQLVRHDSRVHFIELSRNFGHQSALTAGLDHAQDDVLIVMDGDGQHPPELIIQMLSLYQKGYDIVLTRRMETEGITFLKRSLSDAFYWVINKLCDIQITAQAADFRLMSRPAAKALGTMREYHRFLRGMVSWIGFKQTVLSYNAPSRLGGRTKYELRKMLRFGSHALFSFSRFPLKLCIVLGSILLALSLCQLSYVVYLILSGREHELVPGWASLIFFVITIGGLQLVMFGIIGLYIGYVFEETKRRPIYIVRRILSSEGPSGD